MLFTLALSGIWTVVVFSALAGFVLIAYTCMHRRRWWVKLPAALALMVVPYLADVVRTRMTEGGESFLNALAPTTLLLNAMAPNTEWPYGEVFDRLNHAAPRHQFWDWQVDQLAGWCGLCLETYNDPMAKRGVQIAGTLASRGSIVAVEVLGKALSYKAPGVRMLACEVIQGLGPDAVIVRAALEMAVKNDSDKLIRRRAAEILATLQGGTGPS